MIGIDHLGLLVSDVDKALASYASMTGGRARHMGTDAALDCWWARIELPEGPPLELVAPRSSTSIYARDLARRGEGLHHVSFRVADLEQERQRLAGLGIDVVGLDWDHTGWQEMFVHPASTFGALVHVCVPPGVS